MQTPSEWTRAAGALLEEMRAEEPRGEICLVIEGEKEVRRGGAKWYGEFLRIEQLYADAAALKEKLR